MALQSLLDELKRDFEDEELAKIVLETLDILCSSVGSNVNGNEDKERDDEKIKINDGIEVQFCEILLKVKCLFKYFINFLVLLLEW